MVICSLPNDSLHGNLFPPQWLTAWIIVLDSDSLHWLWNAGSMFCTVPHCLSHCIGKWLTARYFVLTMNYFLFFSAKMLLTGTKCVQQRGYLWSRVIWKQEDEHMIWRLSYDLLSLENSSCFHMTDSFRMTSYGFYLYWNRKILPVFYMTFLLMTLNHMLSQCTLSYIGINMTQDQRYCLRRSRSHMKS